MERDDNVGSGAGRPRRTLREDMNDYEGWSIDTTADLGMRGLAEYENMPVAQATTPDRLRDNGRALGLIIMSLGTYWALRVNTPTKARCYSEVKQRMDAHWRSVIVPNANRLNTELATLRHRAAEGERISAYLARTRNLEVQLRQVDAAPTPGALLASVLRGLGDEYAMTIAVLQHSDQQHTVDTVLPHLLTRETDLLGRTGEQAFTAVQQQWGAPVQQQAFAAQMQQQWGPPVQQQAFAAQAQQQQWHQQHQQQQAYAVQQQQAFAAQQQQQLMLQQHQQPQQ